MKPISIAAALLFSAAPAALFAQTIEAPAHVTAVTLFPWGAQVTRVVEISGDGPQEVIVPGLPDGTRIESLRVKGDGVKVGAVTLIDAREPATGPLTSPAIEAARADVERLEVVLDDKEGAVAAIRLRAEAARERAAFLRGASTQNTAPDQLAALAQTVGAGILAAGQEAQAAEAEAKAADRALKPDREALEQARKALAALENPNTDSDALLATVEGAGTLEITTFTDAASWTPAYDLRLDRAGGTLAVDRYVSIAQNSGEDWAGVDLTLSTARPSERMNPGQIWPERLEFGPPEDFAAGMPKMLTRGMAEADVYAAAPVAEAAAMEMQGMTVTYHYGTAVDIRDGVEALRLKLDQLDLPATLVAEAVPMRDETAYLVAEVKNDAGQILLPGPATLFLDGAVVGMTDLNLTAAGDTLRQGFGAIDGLRLKRIVVDKTEGDRGVISKSNERREQVRIELENLTSEAWPVRLLDRVPYSEQDDLKISYSATPAASTENYEDGRGLLEWRFDLAPGKTQIVSLDTTIGWPAGQVLR
ncbi:MAG: DUF4139 domain-containing protein [Paracoccaceae bacterium]|nr:DUF4139 domain-containing protein [Paracoccaceae bacterium]